MFQLDEKFLEQVGLGQLPDEQKKPFLQHVYQELEMRVGTELSSGMSDQQLDEFGLIIDRNDDVITTWLKSNVPDYYNDGGFIKLQKATGFDPNSADLRAEYVATKWLEVNRPDYRDVVAGVLNSIKQELILNKDAILSN